MLNTNYRILKCCKISVKYNFSTNCTAFRDFTFYIVIVIESGLF